MKGWKLIVPLAALLLAMVIAIALNIGGVRHETYRIHFVNYRGHTDVDAGFEAYLRENRVRFDITYHDVDRNPASFPDIIAAIRADKNVDLVVTWGTTTTLSVFGRHGSESRANITDIPGVFTLVSDPVGSQVVPSLLSSGRNITGSWHVAPTPNQFRAMMVYRPGKKIGILYTPTENNSVVVVKEMTEEAALYNVEVVAIPFETINGIPNSSNAAAALQEMKKHGVEWLYLPPDSFLGTQARDLVIPTAHRLGIATFASTEQLMLTGATFGLLCPYFQVGELAAKKAIQVLRGEPPAAIPMDTVERFHHQMNPVAARLLNITVSPALLPTIQQVTAP
jgi:putative ABC transport system substrate-binding protein